MGWPFEEVSLMARRNLKLLKHFEAVKEHVGHRVQYYGNGHSDNVGKIMRVTLREDIEGVALWLENKPFPLLIFSDQIRLCECQGAKV